MKFFAFFLIIILFSLEGCDTVKSELPDSFTVPPTEVSLIEKQSDKAVFSIFNGCASACMENIRDEIQNNGNIFSIRVIAESSSTLCPDVCYEFEREVTVEVPISGAFNFQFIHRDSVYHHFELSFP